MAQQKSALELYRPFIESFIKETQALTTAEEMVKLMDLVPIIFEDKTIGVVGLTAQRTPVGRAAIIRMLYVEPRYRGTQIWTIFEQLFDGMIQQGFTHVEGWANPRMAEWLERSWKIKPKLLVYHEHLRNLRKNMDERKAALFKTAAKAKS